MTDREWAKAFVGCKIKGTGIRFRETVDVLVNKLAQSREKSGCDSHEPDTNSPNPGPAERPHAQAA
jgi:hypothetical protein